MSADEVRESVSGTEMLSDESLVKIASQRRKALHLPGPASICPNYISHIISKLYNPGHDMG